VQPLLGSAVVLELLQKLTPDRHARLLDASEKVVGGLLGICVLAGSMIRSTRGKWAGKQPRLR
jgi:hypothetical protein